MTFDAENSTPWTMQDPAVVKVIDWFVLEDAFIPDSDPEDGFPKQIDLGEMQFFIGPPTCDIWHVAVHKDERYFLEDHAVEIAALATLESPMPSETLTSYVEELQELLFAMGLDHNLQVEISESEDEERPTVFVVRRFYTEETEGPDFDRMMREFIALTHDVTNAL